MSEDPIDVITRAQAKLADLCAGSSKWVMTIPAKETDPDIIFSRGLAAGADALRRLKDSESENASLRIRAEAAEARIAELESMAMDRGEF